MASNSIQEKNIGTVTSVLFQFILLYFKILSPFLVKGKYLYDTSTYALYTLHSIRLAQQGLCDTGSIGTSTNDFFKKKRNKKVSFL